MFRWLFFGNKYRWIFIDFDQWHFEGISDEETVKVKFWFEKKFVIGILENDD